MKIFDIIWPYVGQMPSDASLIDDIEQINAASWGDETTTFLDEARRLRDIETDRKTAAETKSQIYLAALFALITILISLTEHEALKGIMAFSFWYQTVGFIFFFAGIFYGIGALVSSFRALTVKAYHRVDVDEIVSSGTAEAPLEHITKEILKSVRQDRSSINHKISYVIVTYQLTLRMALCLLALLLMTIPPNIWGG